jgi:hypothetical protein
MGEALARGQAGSVLRVSVLMTRWLPGAMGRVLCRHASPRGGGRDHPEPECSGEQQRQQGPMAEG